MKDSLLVLSGGMDSVTMLYDFKDSIALAVSFDYGANHGAKELACAKLHCQRLSIPHIVIPLAFMKEYFVSSLLSGAEAIPEGDYNEENMKSTVVPFRNGIMLAIAAGIADSNKLHNIMLANHSGDHSIYPDCRPEFIDAMGKAVDAGTDGSIRLLAPYTDISKGEIALIGKRLGLDYSETWSCYKGGTHHCGVCGTCRERKEAMAFAGINDKTIYDA